MTNKHQTIKNIISTIIIGLVGSGLWEFTFSPALHALVACFVAIPGKLSFSFGNWYVSSIASADREFLVIELRTWILAFLFIGILRINIKKLISTYPPFLKALLLFFLCVDLLLDVQISNTAHKTLQNIEIVSPYISIQEYQFLKSDFYSMTTMDDFQMLTQELQNIATEYSLQLH